MPRATRSPPASVDTATVGGSVGRYTGGTVALPKKEDGNAEPTRVNVQSFGAPDGPAVTSLLSIAG